MSQSFLLNLNLLSWKSRFSGQTATSHFLRFLLPTFLVVTCKNLWIMKLREITFTKHLKGLWWLDRNKKAEAVVESLAGIFFSRFPEWKKECVPTLKVLRLQTLILRLVQFELVNPLGCTKPCSYRKRRKNWNQPNSKSKTAAEELRLNVPGHKAVTLLCSLLIYWRDEEGEALEIGNHEWSGWRRPLGSCSTPTTSINCQGWRRPWGSNPAPSKSSTK